MKDSIIVAGLAVAFGCLFARRSPASMALQASILARASWLMACEMAEGAWERRTRWHECKESAWRAR